MGTVYKQLMNLLTSSLSDINKYIETNLFIAINVFSKNNMFRFSLACIDGYYSNNIHKTDSRRHKAQTVPNEK